MASNVERHREAQEAFNRRDWEAMRKLLADTVSFTDQARQQTLKSADEYVAWGKDWVAAFSDGQITDADFIDGGEWTVCHLMGRCTNEGPLGPLPSTGRRASLPMCEIFHWNEEGKVFQGASFYDQLSLLVQLGHAEPPSTG